MPNRLWVLQPSVMTFSLCINISKSQSTTSHFSCCVVYLIHNRHFVLSIRHPCARCSIEGACCWSIWPLCCSVDPKIHASSHDNTCVLSGWPRTTQATSLDDSLQNINKLASVAEGGGSNAIASREQNEGREKLQVRPPSTLYHRKDSQTLTSSIPRFSRLVEPSVLR